MLPLAAVCWPLDPLALELDAELAALDDDDAAADWFADTVSLLDAELLFGISGSHSALLPGAARLPTWSPELATCWPAC